LPSRKKGATVYPEDSPATLTRSERHRAIQRALADALQLSRLLTDVLVRLDEADQAGDDEAALHGHAELDHIMVRLAEAESVRTEEQAALRDENDLKSDELVLSLVHSGSFP
jgi:hypothetical protein